jgi:hypothetical protein
VKPDRANVLLGILFVWAALVAGAAAQPANDSATREKPKLDEHTLFLVHFNKGFEADYSHGDGKPLPRDNRGGAVLVPGKFGRALRVPRNAFGLAYSAEKNIASHRGTVEFWVRGAFPAPTADDPVRFCLPFFGVGSDQTGLGIARGQYNHLTCGVAEGYHNKISLAFTCEGQNRIADGRWHHLAATWDDQHAAFFLDGRREAFTEKPVYPTVDNWTCGSIAIGYAIDADYYYAGSSDKGGFVPRSAQGDIDELRISDVVRYIADFRPPEAEFPIETRESGGAAVPAIYLPTGQPRADGFPPPIEGRPSGGVTAVEGPRGKAAYLHAAAAPGDALYYRLGGRFLNPFLGAAECTVKVPWKAGDGKRHIILDLRNRSRTGYLLEKKADGRIVFSSQENGKILAELSLPAAGICDGQWHRLRAAWNTAGFRLLVDSQPRAESADVVVPSAVCQDLFVGSCYEATDQLEGAIADVHILPCGDTPP